MSKAGNLFLQTTGPLAVALSALCATSAWSATQVSYKVDFVAPEVPPALEDIMDVDKLGFDCIHEDKIDLAFHATGKGIRMPRTCLPEPCKKALLPEELALLVGRPTNEKEWNQYFSRYADVCRKEIPPIATDDGTNMYDRDISSTSITPVDAFWNPLITTFRENRTRNGTTRTPNRPTGGGRTVTPVFSSLPPLGAIAPQRDIITPSRTSMTSTPVPVPSPVPLPAAFWLLLAGLGGIAVSRWRSKRTAA